MRRKTRNVITAIVILQLLFTVGIFTLPQVVRALPGVYYIRLQHHPLTAEVMALITTPIPTALPAPVAANAENRTTNTAELPAIPGLPENDIQPQATATPTPTPTKMETAESTDPTTSPTPAPTATNTPTPEPRPPRVMLDNLDVVIQGFNNCGPANLAIVLNYFGDETTQQEAASYLKPNREDRNVSPWQIGDYVNEFTSFRATTRSGGNMETIKRFIHNGIPVVVEKGYEPNSNVGWYGHYLTVYGYDDEKQEFYSRDTDAGPFDGAPRIDQYDEFEYWWQQFNYTFYVVYEPSQDALVHQIMPAQLQEDFSMWQYTSELARAEIDADSENVFAHFNLGVSQTRLGELTGDAAYYEAGARAFDRAREIGLPPRTLYYEHRPFMAYWKVGRIQDVIDLADAMIATPGGRYVEEIFWYKGHALAAQGSLIGARDAYDRALDVNANFYPAERSLDWVNSLLSG